MCVHTWVQRYTCVSTHPSTLVYSIYLVLVDHSQVEGTGKLWSIWLQSCRPGKVPASASVLDTLQWFIGCLLWWQIFSHVRRTASPHIPTSESSQSSKAGTHLNTLALRGNSEYRFPYGGFLQARSKKNVFCFSQRNRKQPHTHTHTHTLTPQNSRDAFPS